MKNRLKALLLAAGLAVCSFGAAAYAEESTESAVEQLPEEASTEAPVLAADGTQLDAQTAYISEAIKQNVGPLLEQLSAMTDEQLNEIAEGTDAQNAALAATWLGVKEELGVFEGVGEQTVSVDGNIITVTSEAKYDGVSEKTRVNVNYALDTRLQTTSVEWDIKYPMSKLIGEAGLNTLLGMGTVFIVLIFLSFVIGNIHWIPDLIEKRKKKPEPQSAPAPAPAPAPVAAAEAEEENLTEDTELIAVIAAAIAASEDVPADGFVVRSIRKANRRSALGV